MLQFTFVEESGAVSESYFRDEENVLEYLNMFQHAGVICEVRQPGVDEDKEPQRYVKGADGVWTAE